MAYEREHSYFTLLDSISAGCGEIQRVLGEHLEKTSNRQYMEDIEKDIVTLENLKLITSAVRDDICAEKVGASTELILRIAANDFRNRLKMIPDKKTLIKDITHTLEEMHKEILHLTMRREP